MSTRILLVGMNSFDSGKTTFAGLLIDEISHYSDSIEYFKPISAHNYWQRFAHTQYCIEHKRLFSADLATIKTKINSQKDEYLLNPIHRLYVPASSSKPLANIPSTLSLAGPDSVIALQRFSWPEETKVRSMALVAEQLIEQGDLLLTNEQLEHLIEGVEKQSINSLEEIQQYESENLESYLSSSFSQVEYGTDIVVIESFNDTAWIWEGLDIVNLVLVIGSGQVYRYEPERFRKAAFLQKRRSMPIREVPFSRINDLLKPRSRDTWTPVGLETTEMLSGIFE
ncbi:MAG: hypothetical protein ACFFEA_03390 [Candidatus Thorarchaeota archaeon]